MKGIEQMLRHSQILIITTFLFVLGTIMACRSDRAPIEPPRVKKPTGSDSTVDSTVPPVSEETAWDTGVTVPTENETAGELPDSEQTADSTWVDNGTTGNQNSEEDTPTDSNTNHNDNSNTTNLSTSMPDESLCNQLKAKDTGWRWDASLSAGDSVGLCVKDADNVEGGYRQCSLSILENQCAIFTKNNISFVCEEVGGVVRWYASDSCPHSEFIENNHLSVL